MIKDVFIVWLSIIVISVAANPVTQQYPTYQQNTCNNAVCQPAASQTNPYTQPVTVQNSANQPPNFDGTLNQILMSTILGNPGLQKILDPNTKLFNQNGLEIQRQPKTAATPSVINNYFIVPPEFFNLNDTNPTKINKVNVKNGHNKRRTQSQKAHNTGLKTHNKVKEDAELLKDYKVNKKERSGRIKNGEKRKQKKKPAKILAEDVEKDINEDTSEPLNDVKKPKRRRKQNPVRPIRKESLVITSSISDSKDDNNNLHKNITEVPATNKKRKKQRKQPKNLEDESYLDILDTKQSNEVSNNEKLTSLTITEPVTTKINQEKILDVINSDTHLKNIESPVDNHETKDLKQNNHDTKTNKDTRKTRNPKNDKVKKETTQNITPIPDDVFKNFFPYMYMGNNFYSNGNYPFDFKQFYQPTLNRPNRRSKKVKSRINNSEQSKNGPLPNVIEVKLQPKRQNVTTTTANPIIVESVEETQLNNQPNVTSIETTTESVEAIIDLTEKPGEKLLEPNTEEPVKEPISATPKTESFKTKANLEMPPTLIEDLHDYITPNLEREDLVPTLHTNGIINDYYPVFYDDPYYANEESYHFKDSEDDRHFYTTDREHEDPFNRNRRKYDREEYYRRPNLDIRDRINFRRGKYIERTKDIDEENFISRSQTHDKIEQEKATSKSENKVHFQTPPSLENPDFRTKKVQVELSNPDTYEMIGPIYTDSVETVTDYQTFSDIKPAKFSRLRTLDSDLKEEKPPSNNKPKNDRIETVYAKTRVVKYGVAKEESEENTSASTPEEDKYYRDGHTTFVVAKSLGHIDDYHW